MLITKVSIIEKMAVELTIFYNFKQKAGEPGPAWFSGSISGRGYT